MPSRRASSRGTRPPQRAPEGPVERAWSLLDRLAAGGPNLLKAAEELDRLQARLAREDALEPVRQRVAALCRAWTEPPGPRGERAQAWLVLVGAFGLTEHAAAVGAMARDPTRPAAARALACRLLPVLDPRGAGAVLLEVARARTDPAVRAAAAEALGELRDPELRPALEALLEEDLPRSVWQAAAAALARAGGAG